MRKTKLMAAGIAGAALIGGTLVPAIPASAASVSCSVKVSDYTAPGSSDSLAGVHAAMKAIEAKGGGTLCVDGMYNLSGAINLDSIARSADIKFVGTSTSSSGFTGRGNAPIFLQNDQTLRPEANGNTSSPFRGQYRYNTGFSNMKLVKPAGTTGRVFDFRSGAQVNARFTNLNIESTATGANNEAVYIGPHHQAHGNLYQSLRIQLFPVNNSGVIKVSTFHHGFNNNTFSNVTAYKFNNQGAPCFELRPTTGGFTTNTFQGITGQNCGGGFIHVYGQSGGGIYNSSNWDSPAGSVYRDSIRVGKHSASNPTTSYVIQGVGRVEESTGTRALMSGRYLIAVGSGTTNLSVSGTSATVTNTGKVY